MRLALLTLLLFLSPALAAEPPIEITVESQVQEGERLTEEAQALVNRAHDMQPNKERNAVLSEASKLIRKAQAAYILASEINADAARSLDAKVTDLKGMLFWCNKSLAVLVPEPAQAPAPPPPEVPSPSEPPDSPGASFPAPLSPLAEADRQRVFRLLDEALKLSKKMDAGWDTVDRYHARVKIARSKVLKLQREFRSGKSIAGSLRSWDLARAELLQEAQGYREKAFDKEREIRSWDDEMQWALERVEYFGERAFPAVVEFSRRPNFPLTETLVDYVNRQLWDPRFRFTPVAPGSSAPDPALAQTIERNLSELARTSEELAKASVSSERELARLAWGDENVRDLDAYWEWRDRILANPELKESYAGELEAAARKSERALKSLREKEKALTAKLASLQTSLAALPREQLPLVEAWRLKQPFLTAGASAALEALRPSAP